MIKNLADLTLEERMAIAEERKLALQKHQAATNLAAQVEKEFERIMKERIWKPHSWRDRWVRLVDEIENSEVREAVRKKIYGFIDAIGGR